MLSREEPEMSAVPTPAAPRVDLKSPEAAAAALRTFFNIARRWQLTTSEQLTLLGVSRSTLYEWKAGRVKAGLDAVTLERLSYVFGIFRAPFRRAHHVEDRERDR